MATFGVKLDDFQTARSFIKESNDRFKGQHFIKQPFTGFARTYGKGKDFFALVSMRPQYANPIGWAIVLGLVVWMFSLKWVMVVPGLLAVGALFHTRVYLFLVCKVGLRKAGYAGQVKMLENDDLITRLVSYGPK